MRPAVTPLARPPARDTGTQLAVERTRLAYERTLMAWIRTATALITFGFTIYKFFDFETATPVHHLISPRRFAMIMIGIGLVALLLSIIDHHRHLKQLGGDTNAMALSVAGVVATLISVMGLLAFVAVLFHA